jgi:hypothetical protein
MSIAGKMPAPQYLLEISNSFNLSKFDYHLATMQRGYIYHHLLCAINIGVKLVVTHSDNGI